MLDSRGEVEALELNYLTFYAYNGHYNVFGMAVGAHAGVAMSPSSGQLTEVPGSCLLQTDVVVLQFREADSLISLTKVDTLVC